MAKSRRDIQREIYNFVEDTFVETGNPVILQQIIDKFCPKYNITSTTVNRYLDEMVKSKNPFRLRTWYDKRRYYCVPTVSNRFKVLSALSVAVPFVSFYIDLSGIVSFTILDKTLFFLAGFWISNAISALTKKKNI